MDLLQRQRYDHAQLVQTLAAGEIPFRMLVAVEELVFC